MTIMKKNQCDICMKVKGGRSCKRYKDALICPRCCADKRSSECNGCSYYLQAEKYAKKKISKAEEESRFTARVDPVVDQQVDAALELLEKGAIDKCEKILSGIITKNPDRFMAHYGMGSVMSQQGKIKESLAFFDSCLDIYPYFLHAWYNKGVSHMRLFDISGAIKAFQKVIKLGDPKEVIVNEAARALDGLEQRIAKLNNLSIDQYLKCQEIFDQAFSEILNKNYEKAIDGFMKVLTLDKKNVQSNGNIGLCHAFLGNREEALLYFDKALALDPEYEPAKNNRQVLLSDKGTAEFIDAHMEVKSFYKEQYEGSLSK